MAELVHQAIEGRLNAHREILVSLLTAAMMSPEALVDMVRSLEQDIMTRDGAEDPGLTPSAGYASGAERSDEIREILVTARERAAALQRIKAVAAAS
ncbi:hypothetical protein ACO34A_04185 [Rhizobium sp. ACO-34A]|nr:hypothetical protein [Rhizobium sp. ACO-34A]ATN32999.1 hypothetical protein ACO34A_04185 [Rhizobium sp. ACO-34A]